MSRGPTKLQMQEQLEAARSEAFALRFVLERKLNATWVQDRFAYETEYPVPFKNARIEIYAPERNDGGFIWIHEQLGSSPALTAMTYGAFRDMCTLLNNPYFNSLLHTWHRLQASANNVSL